MNECDRGTMDLKIKGTKYYQGNFPRYNLPYEIGCYSLDSKGKFRDDGHQMKYLSMPDKLKGLHMDLNEGFSEFIHNFEDSELNYNLILKWILLHEDDIGKHFAERVSHSPKIDFVLFRGPLNATSNTLYEKNECWEIIATKLRSVIYIVLVDNRVEKNEVEGKDAELSSEKEIRMASYGFKFEQCMVSDIMHTKPNTSIPVNSNEKYFAVFKGKLGDHQLLFTTEYDCVDPEHFNHYGNDPKSPLRYVELKTSKMITNARQKRNSCRYKLLKWYLQSFFAGVPKVICGFRDEEGIVRELKTFHIRDMPKMAEGLWSPSACLNFTSQFFDHVKRCVVKEGIAYGFYWEPGLDRIYCKEFDEKVTFLPKWYTSKVTVI